MTWADIFSQTPVDDHARAAALETFIMPELSLAMDKALCVKSGGALSPLTENSPVLEAILNDSEATPNYGGCLGWLRVDWLVG